MLNNVFINESFLSPSIKIHNQILMTICRPHILQDSTQDYLKRN